jgi:3',5'-cyclic AMP phosphodiesterase CpdA
MLIAQISDTHMAGAGKKTYGIAPMAENLARCIDHINQLVPLPDVVLVTGDIANAGRPAEFTQATSLLAKLKMPFHVVPGNHDEQSRLLASFGRPACSAIEGGFICYVVDGYDVRMIGLDSTMAGASGGQICQTRADWLDHVLGQVPDKPTLIFMHHPPLKCNVLETDEDGFEGANLLAGVVAKYSNIERIVCGHIHLTTHARWHGTVVSTAPSMGMQLGLDLTMKRRSEFFLEDPGYQLHLWTCQNQLITHTIYVRDRKGPFAFEEH